jgi:hypothetical protein
MADAYDPIDALIAELKSEGYPVGPPATGRVESVAASGNRSPESVASPPALKPGGGPVASPAATARIAVARALAPVEGVSTKIGVEAHAFPTSDSRYASTLERAGDLDDLRLLEWIRLVSRTEQSYPGIRAVFCALSIALNARQTFPPRVRQTRRVKAPPAKLSPEEKLLSHDRQVIDLHWLAKTGQGKPEEGWSGLLDGDQFDFDRAARFVVKVGSAENKAHALRLSRAAELELAVIQSKPARDAWREIQRVMANVIKAVEAARLQPRRPEAILKIMPHVYQALRIANGSPSVAVRVLQRFSAIAATEDQIRRCRDWMKAHDLLVEARRPAVGI